MTSVYLQRLEGETDRSWAKVAEAIGVLTDEVGAVREEGLGHGCTQNGNPGRARDVVVREAERSRPDRYYLVTVPDGFSRFPRQSYRPPQTGVCPVTNPLP